VTAQIRLDHVSVTTADLERSVAFYCDLLGLPLAGRGESHEPELSALTGLPGVHVRWADVALGGGQLLELLQYLAPEGAPIRPSANDPGATHIGLTVEGLDDLHRRLVEAGVPVRSGPVELQEPGSWSGVRCLYARDPDGVWVELVERARVVVLPDAGTEPTRPA
jgi:catechol 2,3-dioxygenase-like lactoylglutathione lyase family enzyme